MVRNTMLDYYLPCCCVGADPPADIPHLRLEGDLAGLLVLLLTLLHLLAEVPPNIKIFQ